MPEMTSSERAQVVLMNEAALALPLADLPDRDGAQVIVAGQSLVQMSWSDFRQSASLRRRHAAIQEGGGLDRMVMAADGEEAEAMFSLMCAILTFLPALRRNGGGRIELVVTEGAAMGSLRVFLDRLIPRLERDCIEAELRLRDRVEARRAA